MGSMPHEKGSIEELIRELEKQFRFKPLPEEFQLARQDLLDYILRELNQVDAFWRYRYRSIITRGIGISYNVDTEVLEGEEGLVIVWTLKILLPKEAWIKLAFLRKNKLFQLPKPHPIIRQRERELGEMSKKLSEEEEKCKVGEE